MATIPIGNFGQSVAAPQRGVQRSADEFGASTGRALEQLGNTGTQIAVQQIAAQTRLDQQVADREAQTTAARVRMQKVNALSDANDVLAQDVKAGKIPADKADEEWQFRASEILRDATTGIDPRFAGSLQVEFDGLVQRGSGGVRRAVMARKQDETQANLLVIGEESQRMAARDRPKAMAEYFAQLDVMGPEAGWAPDVIAQKKQAFKERTAFTNAFSMVKASSGSLSDIAKAQEALNGEDFADLDQQKRAQLDDRLDGYKTRLLQWQEIAAQRNARQAEARLKQAGAAFDTAQKLIDSGIPLAPDEFDRLSAATAGTPYANGLKVLQENARQVGGFAAQPISMQRRALDEVNAAIAQNGTSEALVKRRDALQKVLDASETDLKDDPLRAGVKRGVIENLPPIDVTSVAGLTQTVAARLQAAQVVQAWSGRSVSPLTSDEAWQVGKMIASLPIEQKAQAVAGISSAMGYSASQALATQIEKNDRALSLAMAAGASMTTGATNWLGTQTIAPRPVSTLILRGQQTLKDSNGKPDSQLPTKVREDVAKELGDALSGKARDDVIEAASYIYLGMKAEGQPAEASRAVRLAIGGELINHNGKLIPAAPGVTVDVMRNRLSAFNPSSLSGQLPDGKIYSGGNVVSPAQFSEGLPNSFLEPAGMGTYYVRSGAGLATNSNGRPIRIEVK